MQNLEYLERNFMEHQLRERRRSFAGVRRDHAGGGVRRSARLVAQQIRESRRHDR